MPAQAAEELTDSAQLAFAAGAAARRVREVRVRFYIEPAEVAVGAGDEGHHIIGGEFGVQGRQWCRSRDPEVVALSL